jgi:hypothetical protein
LLVKTASVYPNKWPGWAKTAVLFFPDWLAAQLKYAADGGFLIN